MNIQSIQRVGIMRNKEIHRCCTKLAYLLLVLTKCYHQVWNTKRKYNNRIKNKKNKLVYTFVKSPPVKLK